LIEGLAEQVNNNENLVWMGRFLDVDFLLEIGDVSYCISIHRGRVIKVVKDIQVMQSWDFSIRGGVEDWERFWSELPDPGYHDIFALTKTGRVKIEGNLYKFMTNLRYFKILLAMPRKYKKRETEEIDYFEKVENIVGRYLKIEVLGRKYRVYWEEAGAGIPLVCLHTAGADGQQFRHLMADTKITDRYRVIAFDMPWHGKSLPPSGYQNEEYRLTNALYAETIRAVCRKLELQSPVVMGCSMGGRIILHLARHWPDEFKAVIGLEGADYQQPWYDTEWLNRPDVHGGEISAGLVSGLVAPTSPSEMRWETLWGYLASGPGIFKGDLYFYRSDSDYRGDVSEINTKKCPVFLLTGAYDYSCTSADTIQTAEKIEGAEVIIMENLGHFPMSENPALFKHYIEPVLDKIEGMPN